MYILGKYTNDGAVYYVSTSKSNLPICFIWSGVSSTRLIILYYPAGENMETSRGKKTQLQKALTH